MQEKSQEKPKRCSKFSFKLVGNHKTYYKGTIIIDFKPDQKTKKIQKKSIIPTLNKDKKFFTPTFILPLFPLPNDEKMQRQYENRLKENVEQKSQSQMLIPKPKAKSKYCGVCKLHYEDYLEHINEQDHLQKSRNSTWLKDLLTEAQKFWPFSQIQNCQTLCNKKSRETTCQITTMETSEQQSVSLSIQ